MSVQCEYVLCEHVLCGHVCDMHEHMCALCAFVSILCSHLYSVLAHVKVCVFLCVLYDHMYSVFVCFMITMLCVYLSALHEHV